MGYKKLSSIAIGLALLAGIADIAGAIFENLSQEKAMQEEVKEEVAKQLEYK